MQVVGMPAILTNGEVEFRFQRLVPRKDGVDKPTFYNAPDSVYMRLTMPIPPSSADPSEPVDCSDCEPVVNENPTAKTGKAKPTNQAKAETICLAGLSALLVIMFFITCFRLKQEQMKKSGQVPGGIVKTIVNV